jgi:hypothetical protein
LRDLLNTTRIGDVAADDCHALSTVLSGALYKMTLELYESLRAGERPAPGAHPSPSAAERSRQEAAESAYWTAQMAAPPSATQGMQSAQKSLWLASERLKRLLFRGLDYLPPGEIDFADFGRALLAADAASHPDSSEQRDWLTAELVKRGVVASAHDLATSIDPALDGAVAKLDLEALVESDWVAYGFANRYRAQLGIPDGPFRVWPRLRVRKRYYHRDGEKECEECLLKVGWTTIEEQGADIGGTRRLRTTGGMTLAVDLAEHRVRAQLHTGPTPRDRESRALFVRRLFETRQLTSLAAWGGGADQRRAGGPYCEVRDGALRLRATASLLEEE